MDRGNPLRRLRGLPQGLAQFMHAGLQHALAYRRLGPEGVEERLCSHQLAGMGDEIDEEVKGFGPQGHRLLGAPQPRRGLIEPEGSKVPLHKSSLPCLRPSYSDVRGGHGFGSRSSGDTTTSPHAF